MPLTAYTPPELLAKFRELRNAVDPSEFFSKPKYKKLQELWCTAHFGCGLEILVRPCTLFVSDRDEQLDADFELELDGTRHPFQITEVQTPGRRRGDEYKGRSAGSWRDEDWTLGTKHGSEWIKAAIEKKARHYASTKDLHLLVYLNFPAWDQQYEELTKHTGQVVSAFASVWLLNGNSLCSVKPCPTLPTVEGWLIIGESSAK